MLSITDEARFIRRRFVVSPRLLAFLVFTLALGVAVNVPIVTVIHALLIRPLPYPRPHELVQLWDDRAGMSPTLSSGQFHAWRDRTRHLVSLAAYGPVTSLAELEEGSEIWVGQVVSPTFFHTLGVSPARGRLFAAADGRAGDEPVVVLSHEAWTRFWGGRDIVGATLRLDGLVRRVIGIMAPGFHFPDPGTLFWVPLGDESGRDGAVSRSWQYPVIARLKPGSSVSRARMEGTSVLRDLGSLSGTTPRAGVERLREQGTRRARPALLLLQAASLLLLCIAAVNGLALALARLDARLADARIELWLGATGGRLVWREIGDAILVAAASGVSGLLLGWAALAGLRDIGRGALAPLQGAQVGAPVLVVASLLAVGLAALMGTPSVLRMVKLVRAGGLDEPYRRSTPDTRAVVSPTVRRQLLVAAQVCCAFAVTVVAILLLSRFATLVLTDLGFEPKGIVAVRVTVPNRGYPTYEAQQRFYSNLLAAMRSDGSVVGMTNAAPFTATGSQVKVWRGTENPRSDPPWVNFRLVDPGFFEALRLHLLRGRFVRSSDRAGTPPVVVVNETLGRLLFGSQSPEGQQLDDGERKWTVVGIVQDVRQSALDDLVIPEIYVPYTQVGYRVSANRDAYLRTMTIFVRSSRPASESIAMMEHMTHQMDTRVALSQRSSLERLLADRRAELTLYTVATGLLSLLCLFLVAGGVYGMQWQVVHRRTRTIAVKMACGATPGQVGREIAFDVVQGSVLGFGFGSLLAWILLRVVHGQVVSVAGVTRSMVVESTAIALGLLTITIAVASYRPLRRALAIQPARALREE